MTAVWGPLGWMTLHSVSMLYPEKPTPTEQALVSSWLDMFRDTITCAHCKGHFTTMLQNYRMRFPKMLSSRQDFALFAFRAHNAVNARLSKPVYATLDECMSQLKNNIKTRKAAEYRNAYLVHIRKYWGSLQDVSGIVAVKKVLEMRKIEVDYFSSRDNNFDVSLVSDTVTIPRNWVEADTYGGRTQETQSVQFKPNENTRTGFKMRGGRMRLF
jgi:hypothetical protein